MDHRRLDNAHLTSYCERVGLDRLPAPDLAGLGKLQAAHQQRIGFENLDIHLGRGIAIDCEAVFDKLVRRGRGGYCFEKNRLLSDVLASIGILNRPLLARVLLRQPRDGEPPPLTHVCLLAEIAGRPVIADAGFGGSATPPLPLEDGYEAPSPDHARHRLRRIGEAAALPGEWLLERAAAGGDEWQAQYAFSLHPVAPADLAMANHWTSTRADTLFTTAHIVSIALPDGHASLVDRELHVARASDPERRTIKGPTEYARTVRELFRIALSDAEAAALPLFAREPVSAP
jgi:N-hydroxyarylamine O-acetyltransferase